MNDDATQPLKYALAYASLGWAVFPVHGVEDGRCTCRKPNCNRPGKHPPTRHGFKDATTDPTTIRQLWGTCPQANIGIATGSKSRLLVVDIDDAKGEAKLAAMIAEHGSLPATAEAKTGRSRHLYFVLPPNVSVPSRKSDGLDVQCEGSYMVAPPSLHANGAIYQWDGEATAPAAVPDG